MAKTKFGSEKRYPVVFANTIFDAAEGNPLGAKQMVRRDDIERVATVISESGQSPSIMRHMTFEKGLGNNGELLRQQIDNMVRKASKVSTDSHRWVDVVHTVNCSKLHDILLDLISSKPVYICESNREYSLVSTMRLSPHACNISKVYVMTRSADAFQIAPGMHVTRGMPCSSALHRHVFQPYGDVKEKLTHIIDVVKSLEEVNNEKKAQESDISKALPIIKGITGLSGVNRFTIELIFVHMKKFFTKNEISDLDNKLNAAKTTGSGMVLIEMCLEVTKSIPIVQRQISDALRTYPLVNIRVGRRTTLEHHIDDMPEGTFVEISLAEPGHDSEKAQIYRGHNGYYIKSSRGNGDEQDNKQDKEHILNRFGDKQLLMRGHGVICNTVEKLLTARWSKIEPDNHWDDNTGPNVTLTFDPKPMSEFFDDIDGQIESVKARHKEDLKKRDQVKGLKDVFVAEGAIRNDDDIYLPASYKGAGKIVGTLAAAAVGVSALALAPGLITGGVAAGLGAGVNWLLTGSKAEKAQRDSALLVNVSDWNNALTHLTNIGEVYNDFLVQAKMEALSKGPPKPIFYRAAVEIFEDDKVKLFRAKRSDQTKMDDEVGWIARTLMLMSIVEMLRTGRCADVLIGDPDMIATTATNVVDMVVEAVKASVKSILSGQNEVEVAFGHIAL